MDPDTRRDPSWASSISLIRSASRPPGFRNARHPLFLARPLLFTPPPPSYTVHHRERRRSPYPLPSLSRIRGLKHEADTRWRRRWRFWGRRTILEFVSRKRGRSGSSMRSWFLPESNLVSIRYVGICNLTGSFLVIYIAIISDKSIKGWIDLNFKNELLMLLKYIQKITLFSWIKFPKCLRRCRGYKWTRDLMTHAVSWKRIPLPGIAFKVWDKSRDLYEREEWSKN